jgi:hypothetical protein
MNKKKVFFILSLITLVVLFLTQVVNKSMLSRNEKFVANFRINANLLNIYKNKSNLNLSVFSFIEKDDTILAENKYFRCKNMRLCEIVYQKLILNKEKNIKYHFQKSQSKLISSVTVKGIKINGDFSFKSFIFEEKCAFDLSNCYLFSTQNHFFPTKDNVDPGTTYSKIGHEIKIFNEKFWIMPHKLVSPYPDYIR